MIFPISAFVATLVAVPHLVAAAVAPCPNFNVQFTISFDQQTCKKEASEYKPTLRSQVKFGNVRRELFFQELAAAGSTSVCIPNDPLASFIYIFLNTFPSNVAGDNIQSLNLTLIKPSEGKSTAQIVRSELPTAAYLDHVSFDKPYVGLNPYPTYVVRTDTDKKAVSADTKDPVQIYIKYYCKPDEVIRTKYNEK